MRYYVKRVSNGSILNVINFDNADQIASWPVPEGLYLDQITEVIEADKPSITRFEFFKLLTRSEREAIRTSVNDKIVDWLFYTDTDLSIEISIIKDMLGFMVNQSIIDTNRKKEILDKIKNFVF